MYKNKVIKELKMKNFNNLNWNNKNTTVNKLKIEDLNSLSRSLHLDRVILAGPTVFGDIENKYSIDKLKKILNIEFRNISYFYISEKAEAQELSNYKFQRRFDLEGVPFKIGYSPQIKYRQKDGTMYEGPGSLPKIKIAFTYTPSYIPALKKLLKVFPKLKIWNMELALDFQSKNKNQSESKSKETLERLNSLLKESLNVAYQRKYNSPYDNYEALGGRNKDKFRLRTRVYKAEKLDFEAITSTNISKYKETVRIERYFNRQEVRTKFGKLYLKHITKKRLRNIFNSFLEKVKIFHIEIVERKTRVSKKLAKLTLTERKKIIQARKWKRIVVQSEEEQLLQKWLKSLKPIVYFKCLDEKIENIENFFINKDLYFINDYETYETYETFLSKKNNLLIEEFLK